MLFELQMEAHLLMSWHNCKIMVQVIRSSILVKESLFFGSFGQILWSLFDSFSPSLKNLKSSSPLVFLFGHSPSPYLSPLHFSILTAIKCCASGVIVKHVKILTQSSRFEPEKAKMRCGENEMEKENLSGWGVRLLLLPKPSCHSSVVPILSSLVRRWASTAPVNGATKLYVQQSCAMSKCRVRRSWDL